MNGLTRRHALRLAIAAALAGVPVLAQQAPAAGGYGPGTRVLLDAHNAYPTEGGFADRIDRALATGLPLAIEQDLFWFKDPRSGVGRSVVAHVPEEAPTAPAFEDYFFAKVAPIMEKAVKENRRADWPLITLNLDFKSNEPEHHAAVWALLGKYQSWLTTAERTATADVPSPLTVGPMLVLTGSNPLQQTAFHDNVPVGQRLRVFGATLEPKVAGATAEERAKNYSAVPVDAAVQFSASNYRRWANFPWAVVEAGGQTAAGDWTEADQERLAALVARAHALHLWIRFYTLNGHAKDQGKGWSASYNFGSEPAAALRWRAAIDAGVDFIASDQYEAMARVKKSRP
jgi:hypothetical protein